MNVRVPRMRPTLHAIPANMHAYPDACVNAGCRVSRLSAYSYSQLLNFSQGLNLRSWRTQEAIKACEWVRNNLLQEGASFFAPMDAQHNKCRNEGAHLLSLVCISFGITHAEICVISK